MDHLIDSVYAFNEQIIGMAPDLPLQPLSKELRNWFTSAIHEEIEEYNQAWLCQDLIGQVDAIIDLMYFAIGRLQQMGLTREQARDCFMAVHTANMTKKRGAQAKRGNLEADAVKPAEWVPPEERLRKILLNGDAR
jgi:predicted HAD superfamily Cof-like phosphohydrolase